NGLIIAAVAYDHHLQTPMYFFLLSLSLLDLAFISTTVPKTMANILCGSRAISYQGCAAQLHYGTLLGSKACAHMAAAAWASGFLHAVVHTANIFSVPLCKSNAVGQFFCEIPKILKLACSDAYLRKLGLIVVSACLCFGCFVFIVLSYVQIFRAVLRIPSKQGRHKAFSTCLPHLAVVSLFLSSVVFAHLKPPSISSSALDLGGGNLYSVVPPVVNPLIYSLRNKEIKEALQKLFGHRVLQQQ
ncbi:olfactory receptor 14J1, partial [Egretta garzetta]|uniref:olfactory receptor 14J1 n=1 Tax=Egretta garzetta TaxID=188379 RepID=UPI00163CAB0D